MVGRLDSFWKGLFLLAMLDFWGVLPKRVKRLTINMFSLNHKLHKGNKPPWVGEMTQHTNENPPTHNIYTLICLEIMVIYKWILNYPFPQICRETYQKLVGTTTELWQQQVKKSSKHSVASINMQKTLNPWEAMNHDMNHSLNEV